MRRSAGSPVRNVARVSAAISPVVNSQLGLTKSGIDPSVTAFWPRSERCSAAEGEELGSVVVLFQEWIGEVEAQRTER